MHPLSTAVPMLDSSFHPSQASTSSLKDDPGTPEECNLFVGDLARNLTEEKLEKAFSQHGRVSMNTSGDEQVERPWDGTTRIDVHRADMCIYIKAKLRHPRVMLVANE